MLFLKMEIELNGRVIIRTAPQYMPPPLTLDPGIPTIISGTDLYPFLDPKNMDFVGYSRDSYLHTKSLPEGAYVITFTAYDYARREVALSRGGAMFCYLAKTDPPLLNFPLNNTGVPSSPSQYITFQWLSRSTSSPNSAQSTGYRFELFEMRINGSYPSEIVQNSRPIFTAETDRTSLAYTIADPLLENGLRYAWRIRAFDTEGRDYIRNNGYSEVFSFVYGVTENTVLPSDIVENFVARAISTRKAKLSWDASTEFNSYKVFYRKQGNENKWYDEETVQNTLELNGLSPGKIYECRVQGKKNSIWGGLSVTDTVLQPMPPVIICGSPYLPLMVSNREPMNELLPLQEIDAGGFIVTIIDAKIDNGAVGRFSGKGFVQVPLFENKKIRCEFTNIFVNTDYQLAEGVIRLITDKSEGADNAMWDIDKVFEGGSENGTVISGTEGVTVILPDVLIPGTGAITLDTAKRKIVIVTATGDIVRKDVSKQLEGKVKTITVKDSGGNLYSVDTKTGKATSIGKAPAGGSQQQTPLPAAISSDKGTVLFEAITGETNYAFDKRNTLYARSSMFTEKYKTMPMSDGTLYDIPFKLIPTGETDVVLALAKMKDKTLSPDSVVFQSGIGTRYAAQHTGTKGEYLLTLPSGKDNDGIDVYAIYPRKNGQPDVLGKLTVMSYSMKRPRVVLVPVNGNDLDAAKVKEELDNVYLPVAVDWQVSTDTSNFSASADSLDVTGSGLFSQYTPGMKKLNNAFVAHKKTDFDASAIYLFVLQYSDKDGATGDMPRSKQFGYLFTKTALAGGEKALYRTIAHEIAHGAFHLNHTFDSNYQIAEGTTNNLMDYTSGTDLVKHQWDAIHDPGMVIGIFEKDEEGMSIAAGYLAATEEKNGINMTSSITCLSGGGVPITLPDVYKRQEFYTDNPVIGEGTLVGFTTQNDEWYVGVYEAKSKKFLGYSKVINSTTKNILEKVEFQNGAPVLYPDKKTKEIKNDANAKVFLGFRTGCSIEVRTIPLSQFSSKIINDINYGGGDLTDIKTSYQAASIFHYNEFDDRLCPCIRKLNPLTFKDVFVGYEWARYNAYGEGGVLMKLTVKGEDEFYYTNQDATGNAYCYRYDFVGKNWVVEPMPQPTPGDYTAAIFSSGFALKFLKELAPTALDVLGSVPVYGIPFNLVNGVWYSIKNENTSAAISFASCIPIEGAILVGLKWTHQIIQTGENSYRLLKISEEANSIIKTLVTNAEQVSKSVLDDGIKEIISLAEKYPDFRQSIKSLAEQVKDREKFKNILNKINSIDDASLFLKDISITSDDAVHLANNLNKIDEGIIDAWLLLDGSTGIRKNIDNLENLSKVLKSEIYKNWGTLDGLKIAVNKSTNKTKFIELLSNARVKLGTNGKVAIIGTDLS